MIRTVCVFVTALALVSEGHDFAQYTVIDRETKDFLRSNWLGKENDTTYRHGILSLFGNSLTADPSFWEAFLESDVGPVPGTHDSGYTWNYKCAFFGNTIWDAVRCVTGGVDRVKPEVVLMMYGTNEAGSAPSDADWTEWKNAYDSVLDSLLKRGIIPIVSTIPPLAQLDWWDTSAVPVDSTSHGINDTLRALTAHRHVVLVDYYQAVMDYTNGDPFTDEWYGDTYVHPSGGCEPDTSEPACGCGIRNAVCWHAVNKVYRIIIDDGEPDSLPPVAVCPGVLQMPPSSTPSVLASCASRVVRGRAAGVSAPVRLIIVDPSGREVVRGATDPNGAFAVDTHGVAPGLYLLQVGGGSHRATVGILIY